MSDNDRRGDRFEVTPYDIMAQLYADAQARIAELEGDPDYQWIAWAKEQLAELKADFNAATLVIRTVKTERAEARAEAERWAARLDQAHLNHGKTHAEVERLRGVGDRAMRALLRGHDYDGRCPDEVEGWDARDPNCLACMAIVDLERALTPPADMTLTPEDDDE